MAIATVLTCLGLLLAESGGAAQARGSSAATRAGALELAWEATGRITRVRCGGEDVTGAGVALSGFALRDCAREPDYEPLSGTVSAGTAGSVRFEGRNAAGALAVSADCVPERDWLVVRGEVQNLSNEDHAVSLRFALPVACQGWRWGDQLHRTSVLVEGATVHLGLPTALGTGRMALRPVAAMASDSHTLGLAVPVDRIGLYDFTGDVGQGLFSVVFDFVLSRRCPRFFERVPFEFYVVGEADGWGLRSVVARYYANRPELFRRHTEEAGGWFAWGDLLRQPEPVCDYGLMFHEQPESEEGYLHDKALGLRVYPYIEPFMYQMCLGDQPIERQPDRELVLTRLAEWAKPETTGRLPSGGWRTQEALRGICKSLQQHGPWDANGQSIIGAVGRWNWISGSKWAAQFPLDLTPGVPEGAGQDRLAYVRDELLTRSYLNGIYLDSMANHLGRVYYPKDTLQYLTYAPPFDGKSFEPASLIGFAAWEWVEALWEMLPGGQKELLPNLYNQRVPVPWHRLTVMGKEHWCDATGSLMQQYRTMGYRKVVTQLPAYEDRDERFLRNLLLLDVFPGGYARRATDPPLGMRDAYRVVIPLLRQLHRLGWEPVTHARAASTGAMIERYGSAPDPICFAVYNPYEAGIVRLEIDADALALSGGAYVVDVVDGADVEYVSEGSTLTASIGLAGDATTLLLVVNKEGHSRWLRMLADDRLDDVRLCLKEHALRRPVEVHPEWATVEKLTSTDPPAAIDRAAASIRGETPTEVRARELLSLAADATRQAANPTAPPSRRPTAPASAVVLPWREPFDELSPQRWQPTGGGAIRAAGGRLETELPADATSAEISTTQSWPFVPHPLVIETDFKFTHGDHDRYLRLSMRIAGTPSGGEEYLLVRIESSSNRSAQIRAENHNAPPTDWQHTLTEWTAFDPAKPHHLKLRLDQESFRLELDDALVGEGSHECGFGWAYLTLGVYSGHRGHGDVCWWDELVVDRAREG